jgi:hypothetical protein
MQGFSTLSELWLFSPILPVQGINLTYPYVWAVIQIPLKATCFPTATKDKRWRKGKSRSGDKCLMTLHKSAAKPRQQLALGVTSNLSLETQGTQMKAVWLAADQRIPQCHADSWFVSHQGLQQFPFLIVRFNVPPDPCWPTVPSSCHLYRELIYRVTKFCGHRAA